MNRISELLRKGEHLVKYIGYVKVLLLVLGNDRCVNTLSGVIRGVGNLTEAIITMLSYNGTNLAVRAWNSRAMEGGFWCAGVAWRYVARPALTGVVTQTLRVMTWPTYITMYVFGETYPEEVPANTPNSADQDDGTNGIKPARKTQMGGMPAGQLELCQGINTDGSGCGRTRKVIPGRTEPYFCNRNSMHTKP
jgi:hypothetical protein